MQRPIVLGTVVVSGLVAMTVFGQAGELGIDNVATNLYRVTGQGGNTAVFVRNDGVLLVDTKLANNGQGILDQVRTVTDKPITHILNTHTHGDHTGSNMFFPANVEVVVHANTAANMAKMPAFQAAEGRVGMPDRTFEDKPHAVLGRGSRRPLLLRRGPYQRRRVHRVPQRARHALGRHLRDDAGWHFSTSTTAAAAWRSAIR